jgi:ectoine hydroxylase-related dioxygenase (phytanoyl-CoA dioxygenase family)
MPIAITERQQQQFDEDGFIIIEDALSSDHVSRLIEVVDKLDVSCRKAQEITPETAYQIRNALTYHDELFRLIDYSKMLPLVVDVMGVNIQLRTSHVDVRPPMNDYVEQELGASGSFFPWHSDGPDFGYPITNGAVPFFEVKIGYYLTDLTRHNSGAICFVRGSHKVSPKRIHDPAYQINPNDIVEVNVKPGTAMLWRTALWHCLTPNLSDQSRKCLYYGYNYRWMRPGDYDRQNPALLARCTPIQRQLLAANSAEDGVRYMDDDPAHPASRYWRPAPEDIPLRDWADEQLHVKEESGEAAS